MRIVPSSHPSEEDNSQKFWVFGPSFAQTPDETSSSSSSSSEGLPPPLLRPPPPGNVSVKKRPRDAGKRSTKKRSERKRKKRNDVKSHAIVSSSRGGRSVRGATSSERWTNERYERAELKVIDVMREKAAEFGHRIARKDLREGARKHIGDTGLLDHLLKHMAGKVVGDTGERFMRGYSSDGVMQYWLEPADLEESRIKGEIVDACRCGTECKAEISLLKERIGTLARDMEELRSLKELEKSVWKENYENLLKRNIKLEAEMEGTNNSFQGLKENHERLMKRNIELRKRNIELETEMAGMNGSFEGLKDETLVLMEEMKKEEEEEEEEEEKDSEVEIIEDAKGSSDNGVVDNSDDGVDDNRNENNQVIEKPPTAFCSSQLRRPYLQLPCRGRVYVNCLNGSQKSLGHLSPLSSSIKSDHPPSQCTRQRH